MARFISVISGKGGVAKTTTSINLGAALSYFGKDVIVVDGNLTTPNVGLHLGVPVVPINLHHVLQGKHSIRDAVYMHPGGTKIIPASISIADLKHSKPNKLNSILQPLHSAAEFVLIDSAAGLGQEAQGALNASEDVIIVTNAEMPAITDALKTIKLAEEMGKNVIGVVLTKTLKNYKDLPIQSIETMLEKPIISVIPYDKSVREALTMRDAVVLTHPRSQAAVSYKKLAASIIGREYNEEPEKKREKIIKSILKKLGWN